MVRDDGASGRISFSFAPFEKAPCCPGHSYPMTIRSIARQLGISSAAVSLGLHNSPRVSEKMRARIVALAKSSGYIPNVRLSELMSEVRKGQAPGYRATLGAFSFYPQEKPWDERPYLKEMLDAAIEAAAAHGYRMEYFWLRKPGLSVNRFCSILRARGIQGLFCLGSPEVEDRIPEALWQFGIVVQGPSIADKLHRVVTHAGGDTRRLVEELLARGYRRPGLGIVPSGDQRGNYVYSSSFAGFQERGMFEGPTVPILRAETWDEAQFHAWREAYRPDVIILHQLPAYIQAVDAALKRWKIKVPRDVGLALLNTGEKACPTHSGIFQHGPTCGVLAAEMLMGRMHLRDFGSRITTPKIELFDGQWRDGTTLRTRPARRKVAS